MSQILAARIYQTDSNGQPVSYRTMYYKWFDATTGRPSMGSKADAVKMDPGTAQQVLSQLRALTRLKWHLMKPDEKPPRHLTVEGAGREADVSVPVGGSE